MHVTIEFMVPTISIPQSISNVPFHSQLTEITSPKWRTQGCGITSLAMIVDFYKQEAVSVNTMLAQGIAAGAYINNVGWSYKGLIQVAKKYDLAGASYDLANSTMTKAFAEFKKSVESGPVIASVHYKMDPKSPLPHLVVIDGIDEGMVYYNDPAAKTGQKKISTADFMKAWKKRFIVIRPAKEKVVAMATPLR
jgi:predicted double-glycine peptidase